MIALVDCNNFFVSCERLFRPDLTGKPVVVLSSNDGCVVARSTESKQLGIPMGAPAFKFRRQFKEQGIIQFSANFPLYGDISHRLLLLLTAVTPQLEAYSVDESFLDLSELAITDYTAWAADLRRHIWRTLGVPVSIGIAPTKTLAKLATDRAKKNPDLQGVLSAPTADDLEATPIGKVWGIGWRLAPKLRAIGVQNALQFSQLSRAQATQLMGVHGRQLQCELNGINCLPLAPRHAIRQSIMHGRMLGQDTSDPDVVRAAIASLAAKAARGLRSDGLLARQAVISLSTNWAKPGYVRKNIPLRFATPTADAGQISAAAQQVITKPLQNCHRVNVLLFDLVSNNNLQTDLLGNCNMPLAAKNRQRLQAVDQIVERYGPHSIGYAAEKLSDAWQPKRRLRSPAYTTDWDELPIAQLRYTAKT